MNEGESQRQYTFCLGDLPKLDLQVDKGKDFTTWHSLSGLDREEALRQVEALGLCFLRETLGIVQILGLTDAERKDLSAIIDTLQRLTAI